MRKHIIRNVSLLAITALALWGICSCSKRYVAGGEHIQVKMVQTVADKSSSDSVSTTISENGFIFDYDNQLLAAYCTLTIDGEQFILRTPDLTYTLSDGTYTVREQGTVSARIGKTFDSTYSSSGYELSDLTITARPSSRTLTTEYFRLSFTLHIVSTDKTYTVSCADKTDTFAYHTSSEQFFQDNMAMNVTISDDLSSGVITLKNDTVTARTSAIALKAKAGTPYTLDGEKIVLSYDGKTDADTIRQVKVYFQDETHLKSEWVIKKDSQRDTVRVVSSVTKGK